jgi:hypothetical protein
MSAILAPAAKPVAAGVNYLIPLIAFDVRFGRHWRTSQPVSYQVSELSNGWPKTLEQRCSA